MKTSDDDTTPFDENELESLCVKIAAIGPYAAACLDTEGALRAGPAGHTEVWRHVPGDALLDKLEHGSSTGPPKKLDENCWISCVPVTYQGRIEAYWILAAEACDDRFLGAVEIQKELVRGICALAEESERHRSKSSRLAEANKMLQLVLDAIPVRVFWKDTELNYLGANRLFAQDAGLEAVEDLVGKSDYKMVWSNEADLYRTDDRQVIDSGQARIGYEEPQTTPTGKTIWLQTNKVPLTNVEGDVVGVLGTYADITPRKRIEQERELLLKDLEAKNAELERFTYTASHDLKSPLVTIRGFLGLLTKDLERRNHDSAQGCIEQIDLASRQMAALLEDLLEMARIGRIANPPEAVPLRELIENAVGLCDGVIRRRGVEIRIAADLPAVRVDGPRIVQVFQNLIENACKYMGDQARPMIEIVTRRDGDETVVVVADNGIGIAPRYHERVFGVFDKLDPSTDGSGIGLALVKRIVEFHEGYIWIESEGPGRGTAFCFTLPGVEPVSQNA